MHSFVARLVLLLTLIFGQLQGVAQAYAMDHSACDMPCCQVQLSPEPLKDSCCDSTLREQVYQSAQSQKECGCAMDAPKPQGSIPYLSQANQQIFFGDLIADATEVNPVLTLNFESEAEISQPNRGPPGGTVVHRKQTRAPPVTL